MKNLIVRLDNPKIKFTIAKTFNVSSSYVDLALKFCITGKKAIDIRAMALANGGTLEEKN